MGDRIATMRDGVLEQVGDPDSVYEQPANTFVASFIGSPAMSLARVGSDRRNGERRSSLLGEQRLALDDARRRPGRRDHRRAPGAHAALGRRSRACSGRSRARRVRRVARPRDADRRRGAGRQRASSSRPTDACAPSRASRCGSACAAAGSTSSTPATSARSDASDARRSRKSLGVARRLEGSNPSPSAQQAERPEKALRCCAAAVSGDR